LRISTYLGNNLENIQANDQLNYKFEAFQSLVMKFLPSEAHILIQQQSEDQQHPLPQEQANKSTMKKKIITKQNLEEE